MIFNGMWNVININSILVYCIDGYELISKALFISLLGLKGEKGNAGWRLAQLESWEEERCEAPAIIIDTLANASSAHANWLHRS